jgi:hypothetical protein
LVWLSRSGIIPYFKTQDTADQWRELVQMLQYVGVIAAIDESDPVTLESKGKAQRTILRFLVNALKGNVSELKKNHKGIINISMHF